MDYTKYNYIILEDLPRHPAHFNLNEFEAGIYIDLLEREILKWSGVLERAKNYAYESSVKKTIKIEEIEKRLGVLNSMLNEMKEQTAW